MANQPNICTVCKLKLYSKYCNRKACHVCCNNILCNKHGTKNKRKVSEELKHIVEPVLINIIFDYIDTKLKCTECHIKCEDVFCITCHSYVCKKCSEVCDTCNKDVCVACRNKEIFGCNYCELERRYEASNRRHAMMF